MILFYKFYNDIFDGKHIVVVIKRNHRSFILTTYLTDVIKVIYAMEKGIKIFFDKEADVFCFSRGEPRSDVISRELGDDIVVRLEPKTNRVVGFTILNFTRRFDRLSFTQEIPIEAELALI